MGKSGNIACNQMAVPAVLGMPAGLGRRWLDGADETWLKPNGSGRGLQGWGCKWPNSMLPCTQIGRAIHPALLCMLCMQHHRTATACKKPSTALDALGMQLARHNWETDRTQLGYTSRETPTTPHQSLCLQAALICRQPIEIGALSAAVIAWIASRSC